MIENFLCIFYTIINSPSFLKRRNSKFFLNSVLESLIDSAYFGERVVSSYQLLTEIASFMY